MSKEVAKKEKAEVAQTPVMGRGISNFEQDNILIERITLAQGLSKIVASEKAKFGDIYLSVSQKVIGNKDKAIKIVPIMMTETWLVFRKENGKKVFERFEPMTMKNREERRNAKETETHVFDDSINFFVMFLDELGKPEAMPRVVSFMRTSKKTGKQLYTGCFTTQSAGKDIWEQSYTLGVEKLSNDKGTFYAWTVQPGEPVKDVSQKAQCEMWWKNLQQMNHKIDNSEFEETGVELGHTKPKDTPVSSEARY